ncbi:Gfo/Idh/MocA family oxidoreductase [Lysinibacter sp. HNR]|uniref:Gfo/Idh/MocA family protein n=1 Tax=Lysinibacter sp. HNR TaxID=3031408 RepID=UPI002434D8F9|nr:Gfo/Idh/MocA family oxidoreductase [Lysinibacter sp. HNR]WGD37058.1 Gfo/Idh/MocA family oxidoreductase [Lysinibacter sp. HNR]
MIQPIRWGILATGGIARKVTADMIAEGLTVRAVGSRSLDSARSFAAQFGIARAHGSYEELVNDPEVDAVYITTPHTLHYGNARLALRAGKHVLIEKPVTVNAAQLAELIALASERRLLLLEAMWTRFLPHMIRLREIVNSGVLGEIRALEAKHMQRLPSDSLHRLNNLELGGGALLDLGVYPISFAHDILGEPDSIAASASFKATGADSQVATVLSYSGGAIATSLSSSEVAAPNTATVVGTRGWVVIDEVWYTPTSFRVYDLENRMIDSYESAPGSVVGSGHGLQAVEASRLIAAGRIESELISPQDSLSVMRTLDSIREQIGLVYPGEA